MTAPAHPNCTDLMLSGRKSSVHATLVDSGWLADPGKLRAPPACCRPMPTSSPLWRLTCRRDLCFASRKYDFQPWPWWAGWVGCSDMSKVYVGCHVSSTQSKRATGGLRLAHVEQKMQSRKSLNVEGLAVGRSFLAEASSFDMQPEVWGEFAPTPETTQIGKRVVLGLVSFPVQS